MTRYRLFILLAVVLASATAAVAAISPGQPMELLSVPGVTITNDNLASPSIGPLTIEDCKVEDCSEG